MSSAQRTAEWALPCKGTHTMLSHYKLSTVNKAGSKAYGMNLVLVDGGGSTRICKETKTE